MTLQVLLFRVRDNLNAGRNKNNYKSNNCYPLKSVLHVFITGNTRNKPEAISNIQPRSPRVTLVGYPSVF